MKKLFTILVALVAMVAVSAQTPTSVTLTFTGESTLKDYIKLDSVQVNNLSSNWNETLVYPDTILTLTVGVGINDHELQAAGYNFPNPFNGKTNVQLNVPKSGVVTIQVFDINGKLCLNYKDKMEAGVYAFDVTLAAPQTYLLKVTTDYATKSIKMVNVGKGAGNTIKFRGMQHDMNMNMAKHDSEKPFNLGDNMKYVGFAGGLTSAPITKAQEASENFTLVFDVPVDVKLPTVTTDSFANVKTTSATFYGTVVADGGATVTERGFCWSTDSNPDLTCKHIAAGKGTGHFEAAITGLENNTTYYFRAYAINSKGTTYGDESAIHTEMGSCGDMTVKDYDGNVYHTILMGKQCWLKENVRSKHFADGTPIEECKEMNADKPIYFFPDDCPECEHSLCRTYPELYGLLYNYPAVMNGAPCNNSNPSNVQGVCPTGWHVPSQSEWEEMFAYVSAQSELLCSPVRGAYGKAIANQIGWVCSTVECSVGNVSEDNDVTGFGLVGVGYLDESYGMLMPQKSGMRGYWWTTTMDEVSENPVSFMQQYDKIAPTLDTKLKKENGLSVRCIQSGNM